MRTRHTLISIGVAVGLILTACGGSDSPNATGVPQLPVSDVTADSPASESTAPSGQSAADRALNFARCMRESGVEGYADPVIDGGGGVQVGSDTDADDPDFAAAESTCLPLLRGGRSASGGMTEDEIAAFQEQALAFAACMREQGIDFPDPELSDGGVTMAGDPGDPTFQAATDACGGTPSKGGGARPDADDSATTQP